MGRQFFISQERHSSHRGPSGKALKNLKIADMSSIFWLSSPHVRQNPFFYCRHWFFFFIIFDAYGKIQNGLKRTIMKKKKRNTKEVVLLWDDFNEHRSLVSKWITFSSKYIFFRFRTFWIFFSIKKKLVAELVVLAHFKWRHGKWTYKVKIV